jgi:plasmid stabilization system protein ParE
MFETSRNEQHSRRGFRRFVVGSYIVLSLVDEERHEVNIANIFYGRRNYDKYI